jgi:hypothetical protein
MSGTLEGTAARAVGAAWAANDYIKAPVKVTGETVQPKQPDYP